MKKNSGAILIISLLVISILLSAGAITIKIVNSAMRSVTLEYQRKQVFYIAEGGIEYTKVLINNNPSWYTDMPHSVPNDVNWLKYEASGYVENFGEGAYKIVKENGKNIIYSIGYVINNEKPISTTVIMVEYQSNPFKVLKWNIL